MLPRPAPLMRCGLVIALLGGAGMGGPAHAEDPVAGVDATTGLRMAKYRAPTPPALPGAVTLDVFGADEARKAGAVFIDVMAQQGAGPDPLTGQWRIQAPRRNIPGSTWLPDVGFGTLSPAMERYWRDNLARLAGPPPGRTMVIYCMADCWMSWNAARRAVRLGYADVRWFPGGTDAWDDAGQPLADATPPPPLTPETP